MSQPTRYDTFNYDDNYKRAVIIGGRQDEDWSYNLLQSIHDNEREALADVIFNKAAVLTGLTASSLTNSTGTAILNSGSVYLKGRAEPVSGATLVYGSTVAINTIYVEWERSRITKTQDNTLVDPNNLSPVFETDQVNVTLQSSNPDVLDEPFDYFSNGVPFNQRLNSAWTLNSGVIAEGTPAEGYNRFALQMNYTSGTATTLVSPSFTVTPSTTYYLYFYTKTVYGKTDLAGTDGAFVKVNIATPYSTVFATTGGNTLLGGFTQTAVSFTTGNSDTTATITISIPSTATPPTTQILLSNLLLTTVALNTTPVQYERHYYELYTWNRPSTPAVITPIITPKSVLNLTDFNGDLPATSVSFTPDSNTAPDISSGTAQTAIDALSTKRALLAGASTQVFNANTATTLTEVTPAQQVQQDALNWGGTSTNSGNAYTINLSVTPAFSIGMPVRFLANATNTGPATVTINGTTYTIYRNDGTQTQAGDIINGAVINLTIKSITSPLYAYLYNPPAQYVTQSGAQNYVQDTGAANAYVVTLNPVPIAITAGFPISMLAVNANTGASTITVNGTNYNILRITGSDLLPNDITANGIVEFVFDGTEFQLVSVPANILQAQQIYGTQSKTRGRTYLNSNVTIGTKPTNVLAITLTMPTTGVGWNVHLGCHMWTQMLAPPDTSGATVDVQTQITDGTITESLSEGYEVCTASNQTKKIAIHHPWISPEYSPGTTVTFTLQATANTSGTVPLPIALAGTHTFLQWIIGSTS